MIKEDGKRGDKEGKEGDKGVVKKGDKGGEKCTMKGRR